jgi:predicted CoA-substrate-specific enzyme activase
MKCCAGIDAGSRWIKVILMNPKTRKVIASGKAEQGVEQDALAIELFDRVLANRRLKRSDVQRVVATGYARDLVSIADTTVTEITCHARGVRHLLPDAMTIVEIGGQDSKFLRLNADGSVRDFAMNDRCAAGTGRFLEMVAGRFGVDLRELGTMAARSRRPAQISSMCVVFAETEIIGLLASGIAHKDIVAGVEVSIASRITAMAGRSITPLVVLTGGVALIPGMDAALRNALGQPVTVAPNPQMTGALGAALMACGGAGALWLRG